jgi:hypothetical protein
MFRVGFFVPARVTRSGNERYALPKTSVEWLPSAIGTAKGEVSCAVRWSRKARTTLLLPSQETSPCRHGEAGKDSADYAAQISQPFAMARSRGLAGQGMAFRSTRLRRPAPAVSASPCVRRMTLQKPLSLGYTQKTAPSPHCVPSCPACSQRAGRAQRVHHPLLVTENLTFGRHLLQSATPGSRRASRSRLRARRDIGLGAAAGRAVHCGSPPTAASRCVTKNRTFVPLHGGYVFCRTRHTAMRRPLSRSVVWRRGSRPPCVSVGGGDTHKITHLWRALRGAERLLLLHEWPQADGQAGVRTRTLTFACAQAATSDEPSPHSSRGC